MAANTGSHRNTLFLISASLTILGSFLPWECYGGFIGYCYAGVDIHLDSLALVSPAAAVMTIVTFLLAVFIVNMVDRLQGWRAEISVVVFASVLLYFLLDKKIITDNGGILVIGLCSVLLWRFFRAGAFAWRSDAVVMVSTLLLAMVSTYHFINVLLDQIADRRMVEGASLEFGLYIVFIGSLLMLVDLFGLAKRRNELPRP